MLAKYISKNRIERVRNPIRDNGKVYSNPTEETLRALGYKEVIETPMPEIPEGKMAILHYVDGNVIKQEWEITDVEIAV